MKTSEALNKAASNESGVRADFLYGNILDQKRYIYALNYVYNKAVLDCACGVGWGSNLMANAGARSVMGLDISQDAVATAVKYYSNAKTAYRCAKPSEVETSQKFDVITTFETIEHVEEPLEFLVSLKALSHDETIAFLSTPNSFCFKRDGDKPYNPYHLKEFTKEELLILFSGAGWRVCEYLGQYPIDEQSEGIEQYRRFIKAYWDRSKRAARYGIAYRLLNLILRKAFLGSLREPAHESDCNPVAVTPGYQPAYHFFVLRPAPRIRD